MVTKMHVKTGDTVVVITGKDAGTKGKVMSVLPKTGRVVVEKVNVVSKHTKPTQNNPQGGIMKKEAPIDASNVMLYCDKCGKGVRTGKEVLADGTRVRKCVVCGTQFK